MRVVFFGIYQIGVESLAALLKRGVEIVAVVTKPSTTEDRQPVAEAARQRQLPLFAPESPRDLEFLEQVRKFCPELIVVAGYHKILSKELLEIPSWGAINLHPSLLPKYRGPCPWKWAIVNGELVTGATVIMMNQGLDCGDILAQRTTPIDDADTSASLFSRLSVFGSQLLADTIEAIQTGTATRTAQDESLASYQSAPTQADAHIDWSKSASCIRNLVRGFHSRPGAWTTYAGEPLIIRKVSVQEGALSSKPGTIIDVHPNSLLVSTADGIIAIDEMALRGRPSGDAKTLAYRTGTCFV